MGWTGRAPAPTATELVLGFREHEERITMTCKRDVAIVHTIGIDTGKNTLHMVGLDETGAARKPVLRWKPAQGKSAGE